MNDTVVESVIQGNLEALDQGLKLVESLTDEQYTYVAKPFVTSNIGQHFRHLVDLFLAVVNGAEKHEINYDDRRRGALIESSRAAAVDELKHIKSWMLDLAKEPYKVAQAEETLRLKTEVTLNDTASVTFKSTLLRELVFTSSHAVHHFALINIIAKMQGVQTDQAFGVAPATASFLRASHTNEHTNGEVSGEEQLNAADVSEVECVQ